MWFINKRRRTAVNDRGALCRQPSKSAQCKWTSLDSDIVSDGHTWRFDSDAAHGFRMRDTDNAPVETGVPNKKRRQQAQADRACFPELINPKLPGVPAFITALVAQCAQVEQRGTRAELCTEQGANAAADDATIIDSNIHAECCDERDAFTSDTGCGTDICFRTCADIRADLRRN